MPIFGDFYPYFAIFLLIFAMWDGRLNIETIEPPPPLFEPPPPTNRAPGFWRFEKIEPHGALLEAIRYLILVLVTISSHVKISLSFIHPLSNYCQNAFTGTKRL